MTFCGEEEQGSDAPGGFLCRRQKKTSEQSGLCSDVERAKGIEPSYSAWEADVLPLNYARESYCVVYYTPWEGKSQSRIEKNAGRAGGEM